MAITTTSLDVGEKTLADVLATVRAVFETDPLFWRWWWLEAGACLAAGTTTQRWRGEVVVRAAQARPCVLQVAVRYAEDLETLVDGLRSRGIAVALGNSTTRKVALGVRPSTGFWKSANAKAEWEDFLNLPGTRLVWRRAKWFRYQLVGADGAVLVDARRAGSKAELKGMDGRVYAARRQHRGSFPERNDLLRVDYVDSVTGDCVLWTIGRHFNFDAETIVHFPNGGRLSLPVRGSARHNWLTMTAIDDAGETVARFRRHETGTWFGCDIALPPGRRLTAQLTYALAVACPELKGFAKTPGE